jgi:MerR family regulatory protein
MTGTMTIGALARRAGVNPRTLRYYERIGLLAPSARTEWRPHTGWSTVCLPDAVNLSTTAPPTPVRSTRGTSEQAAARLGRSGADRGQAPPWSTYRFLVGSGFA